MHPPTKTSPVQVTTCSLVSPTPEGSASQQQPGPAISLPSQLPAATWSITQLTGQYGLSQTASHLAMDPGWVLELLRLKAWLRQPIQLTRDRAAISSNTWHNLSRNIDLYQGFLVMQSVPKPALCLCADAHKVSAYFSFLQARDVQGSTMVQYAYSLERVQQYLAVTATQQDVKNNLLQVPGFRVGCARDVFTACALGEAPNSLSTQPCHCDTQVQQWTARLRCQVALYKIKPAATVQDMVQQGKWLPAKELLEYMLAMQEDAKQMLEEREWTEVSACPQCLQPYLLHLTAPDYS